MKRVLSVVAMAAFSAVASSGVVHSNRRRSALVFLPTCQRSAVFLADGGEPVPPWPPNGQVTSVNDRSVVTKTMLADGGEPVPPWPPNGEIVRVGGRPADL